jgi:hypothetical protein
LKYVEWNYKPNKYLLLDEEYGIEMGGQVVDVMMRVVIMINTGSKSRWSTKPASMWHVQKNPGLTNIWDIAS